jgi:hypothetical protein
MPRTVGRGEIVTPAPSTSRAAPSQSSLRRWRRAYGLDRRLRPRRPNHETQRGCVAPIVPPALRAGFEVVRPTQRVRRPITAGAYLAVAVGMSMIVYALMDDFLILHYLMNMVVDRDATGFTSKGRRQH